MPTFESPKQAVHAGQVYIKNAEDALDQKVIREDQLYKWENQLQAIDEFLADTEDMDHSEDLAQVRGDAREKKTALEANIADFFDQPVEHDDPEANIEALLGVGVEIIEEAEKIEVPLLAVKGWLADTEPYDEHPVMGQARKDMKSAKFALEERLASLVEEWKQNDPPA
ncbi:MAG: hypothetical protein R3185_00535 [Candidatus Thermoplasmatota archaeon]|nr:hypothetical protein [Candidatus Thermoplasmatota archaeon]